jgi:cytochrome c-type biogenesis protein CcmH
MRNSKRILLAVIVMALAVLSLGAGNTNRYEKLGHQFMCVCGCNQILIECNHVGCSYSTKMLGELRQAVDRGDNDRAIFAAFTNKYGNTVLAAPTKEGFNLVAWIMPFTVFAAATILVVVLVRKWARRPIPVTGQASHLSPELEALRARARKETEFQ